MAKRKAEDDDEGGAHNEVDDGLEATKKRKTGTTSAVAVKTEAAQDQEGDGDGANGGDPLPGLDAGDAETEAADAEAVLKGKDTEMASWVALAKDAEKASVENARSMYETLLKRFPLSEKFWLLYARRELKAQNYAQVEWILKRTLLSLGSVKLWQFYLTYLRERRLGPDSEASRNAAKEREERKGIEQAFEAALKHIGFAFESGAIWVDYIAFLKTQKCDSQFDLQVRDKAVRGAYQRAVTRPVDQMETLFRDLENPTEVQQDHMKAKTVYLERKNRLQAITSAMGLSTSTSASTSSSSPLLGGLPEVPRGDPREGKRLAKWRALISYERTNPERVSDTALKHRVRHVYNRALAALYFFPELWHEFAQYELETNDAISARTVLERALHAMPDSVLLHLVLADTLETHGRVSEARTVYQRLEEKLPSSLVFIQFQLFERRCGGIAPARAVFKRARASAACDSAVFTAAALLEFHNNKEPEIARRIFEMGVRRFPRNVAFVLDYLRFLEHLNKDNDVVTLFERVLDKLEPREAFQIWERYREFAARFTLGGGNLELLAKIEDRFAAAFPGQAFLRGLAGVTHRYAYLGNLPSGPPDTAFLKRARPLSLGPHARTSAMFSVSSHASDGGSGGGLLSLGSLAGASGGANSTSALDGLDAAKTPNIIRKLDSFLPKALGPDVEPFNVSYIVRKILESRLPKRSFFAPKKQRRIAMDGTDSEATDLYKKRHNVASKPV
ncbi:mRNA 3'-end-processing protein rna14 [Hondaea fermentalgiana]|uniref:mRNA 3'-end-processing protein rna14 n=1 Tax=Hondaea fermentalgiana TaxID=2315210 RepID=A0A2R5GS46_9STRA|nr:mRNA 3'-end-processing protein rna14 [Hondaea fermentalgiana]|eukprot:GBG33707.1 mRNA 3'-end-processing protein rna14 [Hondaea fermentalgiana]